MSRKIILIKQELLLLVYELNRSGLLAENEKIRPILAQLEKLLLCDLSPSTNDSHVFFCVSKNVSVSCAYTQGKREQFSGFNRTLDAINNVFRKFSAFHDETGRLNVDGMNIISNDGSNKLNRSRKARVSYKVRSEERFSRNAETDLVCRLLLEKKK